MDKSRPPLLDTYLQHFAEDEKLHGAVVPPIFQNSLFVFENFEQFADQGDSALDSEVYRYSRVSNPTVSIVEKKLAFLEKTESAKVFGSGMGAISCAIMSCVSQGSHVVAIDTCYSNARQMLEQYLPKFEVSTTFVEGSSVDEIADAIRPETSLIYLESPSTFVFKLQNIEAVTKIAREKGIKTALDNSYSSPILQNPAEMGVDLITHSATKYLGGHSDIVAGALCGPKEHLQKMITNEVLLYGSILAPFPAWLMLRGLRTLRIRIAQHQLAGNQVAEWLSKCPMIDRVHHVGSPSNPQRELFLKQMRGSAGLLSFEPKFQTREEVTRFVDSLKLFQIGVSWGGFESLVVAAEYKPKDYPEPRWLVRLYCGLEDPEDMVADLDQAFSAMA